MSEERRLNELLDQLHRELEAAENIDAETERDLRDALDEIRTTLEKRAEDEGEETDDASRHHGLFSDAAQEFSASHPLIARTIGQIADILGQSGI